MLTLVVGRVELPSVEGTPRLAILEERSLVEVQTALVEAAGIVVIVGVVGGITPSIGRGVTFGRTLTRGVEEGMAS